MRTRVVSSQSRFSLTMTLYSTMILGYCRIQFKKWQSCHQVPRCWPHSTVCRSPGHGIGRPGLMVTSHIADWISGTWAASLMLHNRGRGHFRFWNGCDTIQDGGRKRKCPLPLLWSIKLAAYTTAVDGNTSQTHTTSNSTLLNALTGKCKHLMPNTHRGWTGHCSNNHKNFWKNM